MYLRFTTVRRGGKTHTYWRLVRSVRVGRKVRQETAAQHGESEGPSAEVGLGVEPGIAQAVKGLIAGMAESKDGGRAEAGPQDDKTGRSL